MDKTKLALGMAMVAIVIAIIAMFARFNTGMVAGSVDTTCQGTTTCLTDLYLSGAFQSVGSALFGGAVTSTGLLTTTAGQLNTYSVATTTIGSSVTIKPSDVTAYDVVILNPNVTGNTTITFFASSTASTWLPTAGNEQRICFLNGTTTAGTFYTFAGGTGTKALVASSSASALGALTLYPQKLGCFTFVRGNTTATTFDLLGAYSAFQ